MRNSVAYYLLLIYIVTICQPIIPWVQDVLAHTFNESAHIATVHHQHGIAHFHYELEKLATKANGKNQSINDNCYSNVPLHIPITCHLSIDFQPFVEDVIFCDLLTRLPVAFPGNHFPPPKV